MEMKNKTGDKIAEILSKYNLKIVDCSFYGVSENKIPTSHHVPSNLEVSPHWLGRRLEKAEQTKKR